MEEERPNYYAIIPSEVRYDEELKDKAKLLYGEITALSNKTGECYATNKYFANLYKVEPETISRIIKNLKEKGYIDTQIIYKNDTNEIEKRVIKINGNPIVRKVKGYCPESQESIDKKVKENNTSINNNTTTTNINNISTNLDSSNNKNIYEIIEENFGRALSSIEYEEINSWSEYNFSFELLKYAVKQAVLNGKYYIKYISAILYQYDKENIRTVQQAQQRELNFQENKNKSHKVNFKSSRDKLRELEEQAKIDDEMEALKK